MAIIKRQRRERRRRRGAKGVHFYEKPELRAGKEEPENCNFPISQSTPSPPLSTTC